MTFSTCCVLAGTYGSTTWEVIECKHYYENLYENWQTNTRLNAGATKGKQTTLNAIAAPPVMDASKRPVDLFDIFATGCCSWEVSTNDRR